MASPEITFHDHIKEFRTRLLWVILAAGISGILGYASRGVVIRVLQKPLGAPLYYTSPAGSFNFILKLSMIMGVFIALPVMIYHILRFIEPALPIRITRAMMIKLVGASFLLALAGMAFGFYLMIPMSLKFFLGYSSSQIKPLITAEEYLSFMINHLLTFAIAFQIPMIFLFINRIKPMKPSKLLRYQRHVIVGAFGLAIVLPFTYDPLSQFIVAIPVVVLFYMSVILLWITNRKVNYDLVAEKVPAQAVTIPAQVIEKPKPVTRALPSPKPIFTPKPVLAANNVPLASPKLRYSMDGFVRPVKRPAAVTSFKVSGLEIPKTANKTVNSVHNIGKPGLSIDGISPKLA